MNSNYSLNKRTISEVENYIDLNIKMWLKNGLVPCQKTIADMQNDVFVDVSAYDFNLILKGYCDKNKIQLKPGKVKKINGKTLKCFHFTLSP